MEVGHPPHPTLPDIWEEFLISEAWRWLLSNWDNTSRSHNWLSVRNLRNICNFSKGEGGWVLENQSFNNFNIAQENWFWGDLHRLDVLPSPHFVLRSPVSLFRSKREFCILRRILVPRAPRFNLKSDQKKWRLGLCKIGRWVVSLW